MVFVKRDLSDIEGFLQHTTYNKIASCWFATLMIVYKYILVCAPKAFQLQPYIFLFFYFIFFLDTSVSRTTLSNELYSWANQTSTFIEISLVELDSGFNAVVKKRRRNFNRYHYDQTTIQVIANRTENGTTNMTNISITIFIISFTIKILIFKNQCMIFASSGSKPPLPQPPQQHKVLYHKPFLHHLHSQQQQHVNHNYCQLQMQTFHCHCPTPAFPIALHHLP